MNLFAKVYILILATSLMLGLTFPFKAFGNDDVVGKLKSLGAEVDYDEDGNVIAVDFGFRSLATDADLSLLKSLHHLVEVDAAKLKLSNVGLKARLDGTQKRILRIAALGSPGNIGMPLDLWQDGHFTDEQFDDYLRSH